MSRLHGPRLVRLVAVVALGVSLPGCMMGDEIQHGYVINERAIAQVRPGMGPEEVLQTLGTPSTVSTVGNKSWYYISQISRRRVYFLGERIQEQRVSAVYFDKNFKVERVALYGIEDGKVFDFITRKTPSGGADQNFVSQLFRGLGTFIPNT
jgi:outer membrane protein assembly factor BamE (lipoprotein component of BamABCDE complex)